MEIPDPPYQTVCSACGPLIWMWVHRRSRWTAFVVAHDIPDTIRVHPCGDRNRQPSWRDQPHPFAEPDPDTAERLHRGAARVRAALADANRPDSPRSP